MKSRAQYRVAYERDANSGWWVATVPDLPGCLTQGRTIEQTRKRIREAIAVRLDIAGPEYAGRIVDEVRLPARVRKVIRTAIRNRGTSFSDFMDLDGRPGDNQHFLCVYQRKGKKCRRCKSLIASIAQGNRSSFFCPGCQR